MALVRAFYCSPKRAEELGRTVVKTYTLTSSEATKLRDFYKSIENQQAVTYGVALGIFSTAALSGATAMGFTIGSTIGLNIVTDFMQQLDNDFDSIATNGKSATKVSVTYVYRRHGSNDGAYFLSSIKVI